MRCGLRGSKCRTRLEIIFPLAKVLTDIEPTKDMGSPGAKQQAAGWLYGVTRLTVCLCFAYCAARRLASPSAQEVNSCWLSRIQTRQEVC